MRRGIGVGKRPVNKMWLSPEHINDLLNRCKLKVNYADYWELYSMTTKLMPLWNFNRLTKARINELEYLDFIRANLHGKITNDILNKNSISLSNYKSVRRAIALLIEDDYRSLNIAGNRHAEN